MLWLGQKDGNKQKALERERKLEATEYFIGKNKNGF